MCAICDKEKERNQKPTVRIKAASSYRRERKLSELGALISGASTSYPSISYNIGNKTKGASSTSTDSGNLPTKLVPLERQFKLKELARLIRGV